MSYKSNTSEMTMMRLNMYAVLHRKKENAEL